jgi:hypothetical protein
MPRWAAAMKPDEIRAERLLRQHCSAGITYEPNGRGTWPDFSIGLDTSVEVRRMNQVFRLRGSGEGLIEYDATAFCQGIEHCLRSFGGGTKRSWFVDVSLFEPLDPAEERATKRDLKAFLQGVDDSFKGEYSGVLSKRYKVRVFPASRCHPEQRFLLAGMPDPNGAGFTIAELIDSLCYCIASKSNRITECYRDHWLILVDHSGFFEAWEDAASAWAELKEPIPFERVFVLHRSRDDRFFDSCSPRALGLSETRACLATE